MKPSYLLLGLFSLATFSPMTLAATENCHQSFYCYNASTSANTAPIVQRASQTRAQPAPQIQPAVARITNQSTFIPRPAILDSHTQPQTTPVIHQNSLVQPRANQCQQRLNRLKQQAANTERQAVIQSKQRQHAQARNLFKKAANLRQKAQKLSCN